MKSNTEQNTTLPFVIFSVAALKYVISIIVHVSFTVWKRFLCVCVILVCLVSVSAYKHGTLLSLGPAPRIAPSLFQGHILKTVMGQTFKLQKHKLQQQF